MSNHLAIASVTASMRLLLQEAVNASGVPGTVTNGMPIGPPFHVPAPKSAWNPVLAPIVATIDAEFGSTGSVSTGVFQMLLAGNTEQVPIVCCASAVPVLHAVLFAASPQALAFRSHQ